MLQLGDVVLPERGLGGRREASRSGGRAGGGQAEVAEDPLDHRLIVDEGDDLAASAAGTSEDVFTEDAQEQLAAGNARLERPERLGRWRRGGRVSGASLAHGAYAGHVLGEGVGTISFRHFEAGPKTPW